MTPYRERREEGHYDAPQEEAAAEEVVADEASPEATPEPDAEAAEEASPVDEQPPDYEFMTKTELIALAQERGISPANAAMSKADLIAALEA